MSSVVLEGRLDGSDRARAHVVALPFDVPDGTGRIDVSYRHDPGHVLDLGLADVDFGPFPARNGFRGWSGGARERVFVAADEATPGYLAGPIPSGTWFVLLGLARLDGSCSYRIDITCSGGPRATTAAPPPPTKPSRWDEASRSGRPAAGAHANPGARWWAGDLQSHTHHSDARGSLDDLATAAAARGLDFVAVTDHNTVSHHAAIASRAGEYPLLIPGQEITTYRGHANVWGADGWVDFRARDDASMARVVDEAHARGGLVSINHPKLQPGCIGCDWKYDVPAATDAFEAWQGPWPNRNWESLARYDALLAEGRRVTLVGGSDRHQPPLPEREPPELRVGSPTTWIHAAELSSAGLLDALRHGRASVSEGPSGPRLDIRSTEAAMGGTIVGDAPSTFHARVRGARHGDELRWVTPAGVARVVTLHAADHDDAWEASEAHAFVRAEIIAGDAEARAERWLEWLRGAATRGAKVDAALRELREAGRRPWIRCLSNPIYGDTARAGAASGR